MDKLLIVDGHNLLWQMFCGMPSRIVNDNGRAIQGTMGFIGALIKIIKMILPTHVIILFDGEHENSRTELLPDYKSSRYENSTDSQEDDLFGQQLGDVYAALDFMQVKHVEVTERVEADDVVSSYVQAYGNDLKIVISSSDSDFFQLISDHVSVLRYRGQNTLIFDCKTIQDRYGVLPQQYADFKSLTGDKSDHIKGAEKVGLKTAAALINQFGSLQEVLFNADKIAKPSVRDSILRNTERLRLNYQLIKLDDRAALPLELSELTYTDSGISTREVLKGIQLLS